MSTHASFFPDTKQTQKARTERDFVMSEQQNMAVIKAWVEAINRNDVDAELACWAPDGEYVVIPTGSTYQGIEQIRNAGHQSAALVGHQPAHGRKQITHLEAGNDWACVSYDAHATITGPLILDDVTVIPEGADRTIVGKACRVRDERRQDHPGHRVFR